MERVIDEFGKLLMKIQTFCLKNSTLAKTAQSGLKLKIDKMPEFLLKYHTKIIKTAYAEISMFDNEMSANFSTARISKRWPMIGFFAY